MPKKNRIHAKKGKRRARRKANVKARLRSSGSLVNNISSKSLLPRRLFTHAYAEMNGHFDTSAVLPGRNQSSYNMIVNANCPDTPFRKAVSTQGDADIFIDNGPTTTVTAKPAGWSQLCGLTQYYAQYRVYACHVSVKALPQATADDLNICIAPVSGLNAANFYQDSVTMGQAPLSKGPKLIQYYETGQKGLTMSLTTSKVYGLSRQTIADSLSFAGAGGTPGAPPLYPWFYQIRVSTIGNTLFNPGSPFYFEVHVKYDLEFFNPNEAVLPDI